MASIPLPPEAKKIIVAALRERTPRLYCAMQEDGSLSDVVDLYAAAMRDRMEDVLEIPKGNRHNLVAALREHEEAVTTAVERVQSEMLSTEALQHAFSKR
jgi:hypothetical protein